MVPSWEEIDYIRTYIEFEQIRISDRLMLTSNLAHIEDPSVKIAPMVLIVFIENAFKLAKNTIKQKIHVGIHLRLKDGMICFSVVNSYRKEGVEEADTESSGIGLANTVRRLQLLYGNNYQLK